MNSSTQRTPAKGRALLVFSSLAMAFVAGSASVSCGDGTHIFVARLWNTGAQCLGTIQAIDTVRGTEFHNDCEVRCLQNPADKAVYYVTSMCDEPAPPLVSIATTDPECGKAIAFWNAKLYCGADAGGFDSGSYEPADASADALDEASDDSSASDAAALDSSVIDSGGNSAAK